MKKLENQVALITGAGRGIGRAIALAYAREGAKLSLAARTSRELEETARDARALGASACILAADVLISAAGDDLTRLSSRIPQMMTSETFTLRRVD